MNNTDKKPLNLVRYKSYQQRRKVTKDQEVYLLELQKCVSPNSHTSLTKVIERVAKGQKAKSKYVPSVSTLRRWYCIWLANDYQTINQYQ